ncbi:MAG: CotH kinase family protein [Oscillospiraceae bacterium]|jgi:hypothetical protein|nr:CotH kinase family protein [Oscillospiraceae bacterium]
MKTSHPSAQTWLRPVSRAGAGFFALALGLLAALLGLWALGWLPTARTQVLTAFSPASGEVLRVTPEEKAAVQAQAAALAAPRVTFSEPDFFYDADIEVALALQADFGPLPRAAIYYTLDGAEPTPQTGTLYAGPIPIPARQEVRGVSLRVRAYWAGGQSPIATHTYFVSPGVFDRFNTLVFAITSDPDGLYGYERGILIPGKLWDDYVAKTGDTFRRGEVPANYNLRGRESERPAHVEVLDVLGDLQLAQGAALRVRGEYTRIYDIKSLRLTARKAYDPAHGWFEYPFFENNHAPPDGALITAYNALALRNGGEDHSYAYVREELSTALLAASGYPNTQPFRPAVVFLNGEYYGFFWLHGLHDEKDLNRTYNVPEGGRLRKIDYHNAGPEGDADALADWADVRAAAARDLTDDANLARLEALLDIDNFLYFHAANLYINNDDWPCNNVVACRYYPPPGGAYGPGALDGRWFYLPHDMEHAWHLPGGSEDASARSLTHLLTGTGTVKKQVPAEFVNNEIFVALMARQDMRTRLANLLCGYAFGAFAPERVADTLHDLLTPIEDELLYFFAKTAGDTQKRSQLFHEQLADIQIFAEERFHYVLEELMAQFGYSGDLYTVRVTGAPGGTPTLEGLPLTGGGPWAWDFCAENTVPLSVQAQPGYAFDHWIIDGRRVDTPAVTLRRPGEGARVQVQLFMRPEAPATLAIHRVRYVGSQDWVELYNPSDKPLSTKGYFLSDDAARPHKYALRAYTVAPGETLFLACKNNHSPEALGKIALSFSLKAGETLSLSLGDTVVSRALLRGQSGQAVWQAPTLAGGGSDR